MTAVTASLLYLTALGMTMVFLFLESRFPRRRTAIIIYSLTVLLMGIEMVLALALGEQKLVPLYSLIVHLPAFGVVCLLSRFKGWRLFFQFLSAILFCTVIQQIAGVAYYFSGTKVWSIWAVYLLLTPLVLWFLSFKLCPLVSEVMESLRYGWWLLCMVLVVYWVTTMYLIPGYVGEGSITAILKLFLSLMMIGFYCVVVMLFSTVKREAETRHSEQIARLSLSALQSRMEAVQAAEDAIRVERHDLRHRFRAIAELVKQGKNQDALAFIGSSEAQLEEQKPVHWCRPPVLDAVFSSYFRQAQRQGISLDAHISLPDDLPVEEAELAIVFSNALENAIHACMHLPQGQRAISCKVIGYPNLMFDISNPYAGDVRLDESGLPISTQKGHGIGSHSIAAFCEKYGASYQYTADDGRFSLRVIL